MVRIKVCGLRRPEDILLSSNVADELGFVLEPTSPRFLSAPESVDRDPLSGRVTFAVYGPLPSSLPEPLFDRVQFIPEFSQPLLEALKGRHRPVVRPTSETDWGLIRAWLAESDSTEVILDPFHKDAYGGTGKRLDDRLIEAFRAEISLPLVIAGGLTPENVADVIRRHHPWGVDVSSGIEASPGVKDHQKLRAFVEAVRSA